MLTLEVTVKPQENLQLFAPMGLSTPHLSPFDFRVDGAEFRTAMEVTSGQWVAVTGPLSGPIRLLTRFTEGARGYPASMFQHHPNRYTRASDELAAEALEIADASGGGKAGIRAIIAAVTDKFTYGHVDKTFYEDCDDIPMLCGMTQGSCVDINTYLISALRAAGYEAGYATGYFFPEEKKGTTTDMHCWVVTRHNGQCEEWDIAHHLKMGLREIEPGLNPKPGFRVPMAHSMGLNIPSLGLERLKLMAQPMYVDAHGDLTLAEVDIRLHGLW